MHVELRRQGDVVIVDLSGRLVLGEAQQTLRDSFDEILAENWRKIILNVSDLARIDSSGVGELVAGMRSARAAGAHVALLQVEDSVRRILHISQVLPLFDTYDDEPTAVAALQAKSVEQDVEE